MYLKSCKVLQDTIPNKQEYPFNIPSLQDLHELEFPTNVTFFVGENGSGKSTLLEAIADRCDFNTAGGGRQNLYEVHKAESYPFVVAAENIEWVFPSIRNILSICQSY